MDRTVARLNIDYLRKRFANEIDETSRKMILRLLAEEEAKLAALSLQQFKQKSLLAGQ